MNLNKILSKYSKENSTCIVCVSTFDTPAGLLAAAADDQFLYAVTSERAKNFEKNFQNLSERLKCQFIASKNKLLCQLESELEQYFAGKLQEFSVPLKFHGSDFQKEVWGKLQELPYGSTLTYGELAKSLGRAASHSRAVGAACGANAHILVVPCHRLVASTSKGGFNAGVDLKDQLLQLEKKFIQ